MSAADDVLEQYGRAFAAGRRGALLDALAHCAQASVPMPQWLAAEWLRIYSDILTGRQVDLNVELGFRLKDPRVRHRRYVVAERGAEVGNAILDAWRTGQAIDNELMDAIAHSLGLTLRQVRDCWHACRAEADRLGLSIEDVGSFSGPIRPMSGK